MLTTQRNAHRSQETLPLSADVIPIVDAACDAVDSHSPKRMQLIAVLRRLKDDGDPVVIEDLAADINWHMNMLRAQQAEAKQKVPHEILIVLKDQGYG